MNSRHRPSTLILAAGLMALTLASLFHIPRAADHPGALAGPSQATATPDTSWLACGITPTLRVAPERVPLGESVALTIHLQAICPYRPQPQHVVFVVDASDAITVGELAVVREWYVSLLDRLGIDDDPYRRIGVVTFGADARTVCPVGTDPARLRSCLDGVEPGGPADIAAGSREGLAALEQGRALVLQPPSSEEILILVSQGRNAAGCDVAREAASELSEAGVLRVSICSSERCETDCARSLASSVRYFYSIENANRVIFYLDRTSRWERPLPGARQTNLVLSLTQALPLVPGSTLPRSDETDGRILWWQQNFAPPAGVTYSLRLRGTEIGRQPIVDGIRAEAKNRLGQLDSISIVPPEVEVIAPLPTATSPPQSRYMPLLLRGTDRLDTLSIDRYIDRYRMREREQE